MNIIFKKDCNSPDFHQEIIDLINQKYPTIDDFTIDFLMQDKLLYLKRKYKDGIIMCIVESINFDNESIFISDIGVGG